MTTETTIDPAEFEALSERLAVLEMRQAMQPEVEGSDRLAANPLVIREAKVGRVKVSAVKLDKFSLAHLAKQHGTDVRLDYPDTIYIEVEDETGALARFSDGGWYTERDGAPFRWLTDDEIELSD